jgi:hypothetical protein
MLLKQWTTFELIGYVNCINNGKSLIAIGMRAESGMGIRA